MGATPTHQTETEELDTELWTAPKGGEDALLVPFWLPDQATGHNEEGMLRVEGGAIHESHREAKHAHCSPGSTALPSTPATQGPWSHTTSVMEEDLYPAEHLFVRTLKDSDDPNETPYTATTSSYPLYKRSYGVLSSPEGQAPPGFVHNCGDQYIPYPIQGPHTDKVQQAQYVQTIMGPNPLVIRLWDDTDKVYSKPLYATPIYSFDGKPVYTIQELEILKSNMEDQDHWDHMIQHLGDPSLTAEVHQFRILTDELDHMEEVLVTNEDQWGNLAAAKLGAIRRLEMSDALGRIRVQGDGLIDDALCMA